MYNFKPQKGKAFDKLPKKTLVTFDNTNYLVSTKYDGNQIFITKHGEEIRFYTSDWKEFYLDLVADELLNVDADFVLVGEFLYDCEGKLGDRRKSAILTTYRTNYSKGLNNNSIDEDKTMVKVFDCLRVDKEGNLQTNIPYATRLMDVSLITDELQYLDIVDHGFMTGSQAKNFAKDMVNLGWEGVMLVEPNTEYKIGKRVNHSIKLKYRKTVDLLCIDTEVGEGKYSNQIGALVLRDTTGNTVRVGSGLSDIDRNYNPNYYIGKIIEIEYEQLMDTYIQPTFICVREDKHESD